MPPPVPTLAGSVLAGRYRLERSIGRGGFAEVYLGRHQEIESLRVAIKVLHGVHRRREAMLDRFRREASVLAMLRNRHTVRLVDFGFTDERVPFLVMEFVEGAPLDRVIRANGALRHGDAARIGIGVLKALAEAHSFGVVHRDLKPGNIFLEPEPGEHHVVTRVLDFGIAKVMGDPRRDPASTSGRALGNDTEGDLVFCTPLYAAPELLRGHPDFRTDLYALGLVMAEILDGTPPYLGRDCSIDCSPHLDADPVPLGPTTLASPLADVIRRATDKNVERRYQSATEMLADLEAVYARECQPDSQEMPLPMIGLDAGPQLPPPVPGGESMFVPVTRMPRTTTEGRKATFLRLDVPELEVPAPPIATIAREFESGYTPTALIEPVRRRRTRRAPAVVAAAASVLLVTGAASALTRLLGPPGDADDRSVVEEVVPEPSEPVASRSTDRASAPGVEPDVSVEFDLAPAEQEAVALARAALVDASDLSRSALVRIRTTAPATVRVDGGILTELEPDGDGGWRVPHGVALPTHRPLQLALVGEGVVVSQDVARPGPVDLDLDLAALASASRGPVVVEERSRRSETGSRSRRTDSARATPITSPTRLGPPVEPRTR